MLFLTCLEAFMFILNLGVQDESFFFKEAECNKYRMYYFSAPSKGM